MLYVCKYWPSFESLSRKRILLLLEIVFDNWEVWAAARLETSTRSFVG